MLNIAMLVGVLYLSNSEFNISANKSDLGCITHVNKTENNL